MSSDDEDDFVVYGTPLDPLDEDSVPRKKAATVGEQVVTDKQGRRRFHGAFTGGFSAGFFNSVGSLEGWTPSSFKSSRAEKAGNKAQQRPEDFMDDEDTDEFGIAPRVLRAAGDYSSSSRTLDKRKRMQHTDGPIPGEPVLTDLLQPLRETVGIRLLMRMGWKSGQGVGPRLSAADKRSARKSTTTADVKVYGCALPDQQDLLTEQQEESDCSEEDLEVTFAPDDFEAFVVQPKADRFGIGYKGLDRRPILSGHVNLFEPSVLKMNEKAKKVNIRGQAFGVGAFEDEDEDIYATADMSQYDFALESSATLASKRKQERVDAKTAAMGRNAAAGKTLEGFVHASKQTSMKKIYPAPVLPPGYRAVHSTRRSRFDPSPGKATQPASRVNAVERAVLIGDVATPATNWVTEPQEEKRITMKAKETSTSSFKPFAADTDKQDRYEQFLAFNKTDGKDRLNSLQPLSMTEWQREQEKSEFQQAARLYKPLSGLFSDRFVSASQSDADTTNPLVAVERTRQGNQEMCDAARLKMFGKLTRTVEEWVPNSLLCKRFNIPQPQPSRGAMQKSVADNKRRSGSKFSIFDFLDASKHNTPGALTEATSACEDEVYSGAVTESSTMQNVELATDSETTQSVLVNSGSKVMVFEDPTVTVDLFKAIFLSSSEGEDEAEGITPSTAATAIDSDVVELPPTADLKSNSISEPLPRGVFDCSVKSSMSSSNLDFSLKLVNTMRNTSPPRGIFANIDFDAINARKPMVSKLETEVVPPKEVNSLEVLQHVVKSPAVAEEKPADPDPSSYGPQLPSFPLPIPKCVQPIPKSAAFHSTDSDSDQWVEKESLSTSKHKHKKRSKKSHKKDKSDKLHSRKYKKKKKKKK